MRDWGCPRQTSRASPVSGEAGRLEYDTVLVGRQEGAWVVAGEGGSADPSAGLSAEADVPYAEPAFTGHLGKTLTDSSHAYPERPVLSDQSAGSC